MGQASVGDALWPLVDLEVVTSAACTALISDELGVELALTRRGAFIRTR